MKEFNKDELRERLTPMQFDVTQNEATEPDFQNEYHDSTEEGMYKCVVCGTELFDSENKYNAGCGWPSFDQPIKKEHVGEKEDNRFFMNRTEVHCNGCGAHLGHVFPDGPKTTGMRYCINSASLDFKKK